MNLLRTPKPTRQRPYWYVDAKWVCGLLLVVGLLITLPVAAAYRLTDRGPATNLIAYTLAGMTSPKGIDSDEGLSEIKARVTKQGKEVVKIAGIEVVFTAEDVHTLSPRELRLKVFRAFAGQFYDQGAGGLAKSQGFDEATAKKFENDASLVKVFSADAHRRIGTVLLWMVLVDVLLLGGHVLFSHRFGKLVSPGVVLTLVGLPGIIFGAMASQHSAVVGAARSEDAASRVEALGLFTSYVAPLVVPHVASVYTFVLVLGIVLLVLAGLGRVIYAVLHRRSNDSDRHNNHSEPQEKKPSVNEGPR